MGNPWMQCLAQEAMAGIALIPRLLAALVGPQGLALTVHWQRDESAAGD
ncbi:MAG: hypothetical protein NTY19_52730 [Planctomycetota bacterium]|nr:hypothetical protein [Planctomycetota bacterium]